MDILFSIKPYFVDKIMSGEKRYEYRKRNVRDLEHIEWAFIYSCEPKKIIEVAFPVTNVISGTLEDVWQKTKANSGLSEVEFSNYYENHHFAYAFAIGNLHVFDIPINPWQLDKNFRPPQSFYLMKAGNLHAELRNLVR